MGKLYGYLFLTLCSTMTIIAGFVSKGEGYDWWNFTLLILNIIALPLWIAESIKASKLLK